MRKIVVILLVAVCLCACGYHEGVVQKAEKSSIMFTGNINNIAIQIDDAEPFVVKSAAANTLYQIPPGKHRLKVYRSGNLVIDRLLFLENHVTTEVHIP